MTGLWTPAAPRRQPWGFASDLTGLDGVFEGYASRFGEPDLDGEVVLPGAFARSLAIRPACQVRMLFQHDPCQPVGLWLSISEDGRGLKVRGKLVASVTRARELAGLIRDGGIDGLSIGFRTLSARRRAGTGLRELITLDLWEISIVTFPLHPGARIAPARSARVRSFKP